MRTNAKLFLLTLKKMERENSIGDKFLLWAKFIPFAVSLRSHKNQAIVILLTTFYHTLSHFKGCKLLASASPFSQNMFLIFTPFAVNIKVERFSSFQLQPAINIDLWSEFEMENSIAAS
jgi:hypothetical protein